jgi:hypothetical protein
LKHLRSSLENFLDSLGYDAVLSEKGDIAYSPDSALDESCYREVRNADIFVLIVGGRYGSEKSETKGKIPKGFSERYDSITKEEYKSAVAKDIPIYILVERSVYSDFETYLRNKGNDTVAYAHVDSINIFVLLEEILAQPRNNPVQQFDRYVDIESWLREQWAGLFRELLQRMSSQRQLTSLTSQVSELAEINKTLKTYMEQVVSKIVPNESARLIQKEDTRLREARKRAEVETDPLTIYLIRGGATIEAIMNSAASATSPKDFLDRLSTPDAPRELIDKIESLRRDMMGAVASDLDHIRTVMGLEPLSDSEPHAVPRPRRTRPVPRFRSRTDE